MEEAAKVIGGVAGELVFFMRSFLLGFLMRLGYGHLPQKQALLDS